MNVAGFQAFDLDDFDRPGVRTASTMREQMGIDRAVFTPTLYVDPADGRIRFDSAGNATVSDAGLRAAAAVSRREGLRVAIKPHVNVLGETASRTTIDPATSAREAFWSDYRRVMLDYAELAGDVGADWFVVGTELSKLTSRAGDVEHWLGLIRAIRGAFDGKLTFAANYDAIDQVGFWSSLDAVACDFFFTGDTFTAVYTRLKARADALGKPYFFTEIGCRKPGGHQAARFKRAFGHAIARRDPRFRGFWWYDWYAFADSPDRRAFDDFTPRLAAREVLRQHQAR
jgi:hypothetical protein